MKKVLFATTALVLTAGMAAAEVNFDGNGRAGLTYVEDSDDGRDVQVSYRLRFNIDAVKELDSGVTLGGRIRLQYDSGDVQSVSGFTRVPDAADADGDGNVTELVNGDAISGTGDAGAELSAAYIYAETSGFRVEIGNASGAFDSLGTLYNAEFGYTGVTQGSYNLSGLSYASFSSGPYDGEDANLIGIFASYEVGGLVARASYHTTDQTSDSAPDEYSVSVDYTTGPFSIGAGYVFHNDDETSDGWAVTGEYAFNDTTTFGAQVLGTNNGVADSNFGATIYAKTEVSGVLVGGFVSYTDADGSFDGSFDDQGTVDPLDDTPNFVDLDNDVSYGIGAEYDLGGAKLSGTVQNSYDDNIFASLGINFEF